MAIRKIKFHNGYLLALLATAQALQVGHSGYVYAGFIGGFIGGLIGAGITLSVTRAAANIGAVRKKGKARYRLALVGLVGLMALNPCLIYPAAYQTFDISTEWMLVMAAVAWSIAPDLSMVLTGAITGTGMFAAEAEPGTKKPAKVTKPPEPEPEPEPEQIGKYPYPCPHGCGVTITSPNMASSHFGRWCTVLHPRYDVPIAQAAIDRKVEK